MAEDVGRRGYMPPAKKTDWGTPPDLFDALAAEFGPFDLDPCGHPLSYVSKQCGTYYANGGLDKPWFGRVFVNPPYGREIAKWIERAAREVEKDNAHIVVALVPARTDTRWWQTFVLGEVWRPTNQDFRLRNCPMWDVEADVTDRIQMVRFLAGRLRFVGAKASAPFPSAIVVWRKP